ncbi:N-formylglutamate deformylase [Aestuariispira ectoiniformans]|uniref:N-formylglutamate deformylase n=1 Tax=Aestuariispira ectoiniformans TaxID=2775080 RepID=UPI00223BB26D|nr:N-formylglutamate deformylase [Aestuariispira ectoiniformans]
MEKFKYTQGSIPLLISVPHSGVHIPSDIAARMTPQALTTPDTDWHVDKLYDFAEGLGAHILVATHSRFVVDLNRPATDENLYPGQNTTGLCPVDTFDEEPVYKSDDDQPDAEETARRVESYWRPYHDKLAETLATIKAQFGYALLWDAHSIRSEVPRFFEGRLPDLNLGTANGKSCAPQLAQALQDVAERADGYTAALNGRFKGGYITRAYGKPDDNIHAVQLEQSQITYMDEEPPFGYRPDLADQVKPVLQQLIEATAAFKP